MSELASRNRKRRRRIWRLVCLLPALFQFVMIVVWSGYFWSASCPAGDRDCTRPNASQWSGSLVLFALAVISSVGIVLDHAGQFGTRPLAIWFNGLLIFAPYMTALVWSTQASVRALFPPGLLVMLGVALGAQFLCELTRCTLFRSTFSCDSPVSDVGLEPES